jgi:hypothetical protein
VLQTWVMRAPRLFALAIGAVTLSGESVAQGVPLRWCTETLRGQEAPGVEPRPCIPFAQVLEQAKRKAREAERRDAEEMRAMRSLAARPVAGDNQQTQGGSQSEAEPVVAARTSDKPDSMGEDTDGEPAEEAASALPVRVAVEPPKRPLAIDVKQAEAQKAALLAAALKRRQAAQARKATELRRAQPRLRDPGSGSPTPTLAPAPGSARPTSAAPALSSVP